MVICAVGWAVCNYAFACRRTLRPSNSYHCSNYGTWTAETYMTTHDGPPATSRAFVKDFQHDAVGAVLHLADLLHIATLRWRLSAGIFLCSHICIQGSFVSTYYLLQNTLNWLILVFRQVGSCEPLCKRRRLLGEVLEGPLDVDT